MQVGADPEFFIISSSGEVLSAHLFFNNKTNKHIVHDPYGGGQFFRDGFALEINPDPCECKASLFFTGKNLLRYAGAQMGKNHSFFTTPTISVDLSSLANAPEDLRTFGCEPSWDAYTGDKKISYVNAMDYPYRHSGGHMHFSPTAEDAREAWLNESENHLMAIKLLDLYLGLPLSIIFDSPEQYQRRNLYGAAGEFRPQSYKRYVIRYDRDESIYREENPSGISRGLEYRTPDARIWNHSLFLGFAFGVAREVLRHFHELSPKWDKGIEDSLREAINKGGTKLQYSLLKEVPGFYNKETIEALSKWEKKFDFQLLSQAQFHDGWGEHCTLLNIPQYIPRASNEVIASALREAA